MIVMGPPKVCSLFISQTSNEDLQAALDRGCAIPDYPFMQKIHMFSGWHPWMQKDANPHELLKAIQKQEEEYEKQKRDMAERGSI